MIRDLARYDPIVIIFNHQNTGEFEVGLINNARPFHEYKLVPSSRFKSYVSIIAEEYVETVKTAFGNKVKVKGRRMSIEVEEYIVIDWSAEQIQEHIATIINDATVPHLHRITREDGKVVYVVPEEFIQAVQRLVKESKTQNSQEQLEQEILNLQIKEINLTN